MENAGKEKAALATEGRNDRADFPHVTITLETLTYLIMALTSKTSHGLTEGDSSRTAGSGHMRAGRW